MFSISIVQFVWQLNKRFHKCGGGYSIRWNKETKAVALKTQGLKLSILSLYYVFFVFNCLFKFIINVNGKTVQWYLIDIFILQITFCGCLSGWCLIVITRRAEVKVSADKWVFVFLPNQIVIQVKKYQIKKFSTAIRK